MSSKTTKAPTAANGRPRPPTLPIPDPPKSIPSAPTSARTPRTPKTPQDEALNYFAHGDSTVRVWELELSEDGGPGKEKSYVRSPPPTTPYVSRFTIHPGASCTRNGVLKSDFPIDGGVFERGIWKERKLPEDSSKPVQVDLPISAPGAFCYYIEYDDEEGNRRKSPEGYFNVDPIISSPARQTFEIQPGKDVLNDSKSGAVLAQSTAVPLDGLIILSIIAKWQGKVTDWDKYYTEYSRRGYNMIHYTPSHPRGSSGSPYSITDQLSFDPTLSSNPKAKDGGQAEIEQVIAHAKETYGLGSITDVVLNHTAFDAPWLEDHPEAGFSPHNTPHLAPAVKLEDAMLKLTGKLASQGSPTEIKSESDLTASSKAISGAIAQANSWQYYAIDVQSEVKGVEDALKSGKPVKWSGESSEGKTPEELATIAVSTPGFIENYRAYAAPFCTKIKPEAGAGFIQAAYPNEDVGAQTKAWGKVLDIVNVDLYKECDEDSKAAEESIVGRIKYTRLDDHGPKWGKITKDSPLVEPYFTRIPKNSKTARFPEEASAVANNGWMWAADPLKNFAEYPSKAYLRREVIVWGDCVKSRYGKGPEDNPWLWNHMTEYCETLAGIFDGFRSDNCHSTPLHVAIHMIDAGRRVNPNLYVMAESFTGSEEMDVKFVRELGINSSVREAYNGGDNKEFSRLLYRYGVGKPIGSMDSAVSSSPGELPPLVANSAPRPCIITPLQGSVPHAVFYDVTHDNESPADKRTAEDALSTGALVTFTKAALGSNKGFDDSYPKLSNLVTDSRSYNVSGPEENGIGRVKRVFNYLHTQMMEGGYEEGHVHEEGQYIMIHRVHPQTHKGYMLVAHTAFKGDQGRGFVNPMKLSRTKVQYIFGVSLRTRREEWKDDDKVHYGIPSTSEEIPENAVKIATGQDDNGDYSEVVVPERFDPGSIMLFRTDMDEMSPDLDEYCKEGADAAMADLDLVDLNVVLHRADGEERDATSGAEGTYDIPNYGNLVYCGLEGWMAPLRDIIANNDLGHPLCEHLRQGPWALDYVVNRSQRDAETLPHSSKPAAWFKGRFDVIKKTVPSFMRPKYFSLVIFEAYKAGRRAVMEQMSEHILTGTEFTHDLALCAVQMYGSVKSASINPAKPVPSLAAGSPHFTAGWARCWGRDVFISLRGLFSTTGNFTAARDHILAFSSTLKHGLIPNSLDSCRNPRYNSRDSPWWMIQNIQDYTKMCPNGLDILKDSVKRRFPKDDTWVPWDDPKAYAWSSTIAEIIQEIVQRHAEGIEFREYNAGPNLDGDMKDEGFNQKIWTDWSTGFIHGGNRYNCGTWMDKNGSSEKAGNKGSPATPRDGAPVEITGSLKSTSTWLDQSSAKGQFPFKGVDATVDGTKRSVTYKEWANLIQANFEKHYYVPTDAAEDGIFVSNPKLVNRRGIYKDVYGTPEDRAFSDYQSRPNFPSSMIVAPESFTPARAMNASRMADEVLRGPLGMKTLDPSDWAYRPDYDNENDSDDMAVAKGWNYHQGPEWGFPSGWFLNAWLKFDREAGDGVHDEKKTLYKVGNILSKSREHIEHDAWRGSPESCNAGGKYCKDSCETQAWSASTISDVLESMHKIGKSQQPAGAAKAAPTKGTSSTGTSQQAATASSSKAPAKQTSTAGRKV